MFNSKYCKNCGCDEFPEFDDKKKADKVTEFPDCNEFPDFDEYPNQCRKEPLFIILSIYLLMLILCFFL